MAACLVAGSAVRYWFQICAWSPASAFRAVRYACIWGVASGGIAASPGTGRGVKVGLLVHPTRLALTGAPSAPSLYHLIEVLGKIESLRRIDTALRVC